MVTATSGARTATPTKGRNPSPARAGTPGKAGASTPGKAGGTPAKKPLGAGASAASKNAKKRPPQPPKPGEFIACKKFDGPRTGMIFTNGPHGLGYYKDALGGYSGNNGSSERGSAGGTAPTSAASSERELDAAEVFATLPLSMQVAFEARDINALDAALSALPPDEAEVHMQRCIASGLWDPNGVNDGA